MLTSPSKASPARRAHSGAQLPGQRSQDHGARCQRSGRLAARACANPLQPPPPSSKIPLPHEAVPRAPIAQLDRATDYGSVGWGFDSSWVHQSNQQVSAVEPRQLLAGEAPGKQPGQSQLASPTPPAAPDSSGGTSCQRPGADRRHGARSRSGAGWATGRRGTPRGDHPTFKRTYPQPGQIPHGTSFPGWLLLGEDGITSDASPRHAVQAAETVRTVRLSRTHRGSLLRGSPARARAGGGQGQVGRPPAAATTPGTGGGAGWCSVTRCVSAATSARQPSLTTSDRATWAAGGS
jgi:hypothetical protein